MAQPDRPTLAVTKISEGVWSTQTAFGENVERKWDTSRLSEAAAKYATVNNVTIGWGDTSTVRFPKHATGEAALCEVFMVVLLLLLLLVGSGLTHKLSILVGGRQGRLPTGCLPRSGAVGLLQGRVLSRQPVPLLRLHLCAGRCAHGPPPVVLGCRRRRP